MTLNALIFDLWGTLIHNSGPDAPDQWRKTIHTRAAAVLARHGRDVSFDDFSAALQAFVARHGAMHAAGRDISQPERIELLLEQVEAGLAARLPAEALDAVEEAIDGGRDIAPPRPAPGAVDALDAACRRDLAVGLVSITGLTPGYVMRRIMDQLGMRPYFDVLTFSDEARLAKPSPEVYRCTLETLGVAAQDAVFIGDSPIADIAGPQRLGMTAVLVGDRTEDGVTPDARIDSLEELFPALRGLGLVD